MTIKTLTLIRDLLAEEHRNARDEYEMALNECKNATEETTMEDLRKMKDEKNKAFNRLDAVEDAIHEFDLHDWH